MKKKRNAYTSQSEVMKWIDYKRKQLRKLTNKLKKEVK